MKRRIGILKGKPIIEGDINLKTSNEIHVKQLSGGSGESGGESSNIEYLDVSGVNQEPYFASLLVTSFVGKHKEDGIVALLPSAAIAGHNSEKIIALLVDFSFKTPNGTLLELLLNMGTTKEQLDAIPRITKEEFYSL